MAQQNMSLEMRGVASPYRQINVTSTESTVFLVFCKVQWLNLEGKHIKKHKELSIDGQEPLKEDVWNTCQQPLTIRQAVLRLDVCCKLR
jgi:hypothetical protein